MPCKWIQLLPQLTEDIHFSHTGDAQLCVQVAYLDGLQVALLLTVNLVKGSLAQLRGARGLRVKKLGQWAELNRSSCLHTRVTKNWRQCGQSLRQYRPAEAYRSSIPEASSSPPQKQRTSDGFSPSDSASQQTKKLLGVFPKTEGTERSMAAPPCLQLAGLQSTCLSLQV